MKKSLGQNFLRNKDITKKIVQLADFCTSIDILEIGPGDGLLTEKIFSKVKEMAIVEIDPLLVKHLSIRSDLAGIKIIHGDNYD